MFTVFYQNLFTTNIDINDWFQSEIIYSHIDKYKHSFLDTNVCDAKIKEALFGMSHWKASGPDG